MHELYQENAELWLKVIGNKFNCLTGFCFIEIGGSAF